MLDITAKHQDKGIASSTYRIHSGNFAAFTHFYCTNAGGRKMGLGVEVNGHAHRHVLILPAKPVFLFFEVKASLGDDSLLGRFTFDRRKCLVEPPA